MSHLVNPILMIESVDFITFVMNDMYTRSDYDY